MNLTLYYIDIYIIKPVQYNTFNLALIQFFCYQENTNSIFKGNLINRMHVISFEGYELNDLGKGQDKIAGDGIFTSNSVIRSFDIVKI